MADNGKKSHNIRNQTPEQRIQTYRRAQAISVGNEFSRRNAHQAVVDGTASPGVAKLATRRAPAQTVIVPASQARFSQQTVTANFKASPAGVTNNITGMSDAMAAHGFDRSKAPMTGTLIKDALVSHDNRRLVAAKTANIWVPMKLESASMQNIDMSAPDKAAASATRANNTVNDFLIQRTSPSKSQGPDPATATRGYSQGFPSVAIKTGVEYATGYAPSRKDKKTMIGDAEDALIAHHPSVNGRSG
jgi:hypothetical protein